MGVPDGGFRAEITRAILEFDHPSVQAFEDMNRNVAARPPDIEPNPLELFATPALESVHRAGAVQREHHHPLIFQHCTLLSIKTAAARRPASTSAPR